MLFYQLLRPFDYLKITHSEKWKFDWLIPGVIALSAAALYAVLRGNIVMYGERGAVERILSLVQILPGFYIAALAAIATFGRNDIDREMPPPTPTVEIRVGGIPNTIPLTRRRFLCFLFAFLTAESLSVWIIGSAGMLLAPLVAGTYSAYLIGGAFDVVFAAIVFFMFSQMIVITFMGLYYLGDRLHQPDQ